MGALSNYKINKLRRNIESVYDAKVEKLASGMKNFQGTSEQAKQVAVCAFFSVLATSFTKAMNYGLFHPQSGVFKDDIGKLNEHNFKDLFGIMIIWFADIKLRSSTEDFRNNCLEAIFDISPTYANAFFYALDEVKNAGLEYLCFYRWCIMTISHVDDSYESMHENSPDCKRFIEISELARKEAENFMSQ